MFKEVKQPLIAWAEVRPTKDMCSLAGSWNPVRRKGKELVSGLAREAYF